MSFCGRRHVRDQRGGCGGAAQVSYLHALLLGPESAAAFTAARFWTSRAGLHQSQPTTPFKPANHEAGCGLSGRRSRKLRRDAPPLPAFVSRSLFFLNGTLFNFWRMTICERTNITNKTKIIKVTLIRNGASFRATSTTWWWPWWTM